jgi:hypothetical protein
MSDQRVKKKKLSRLTLIFAIKRVILDVTDLPKYLYYRFFKENTPVKSKIVFVVSFPRSGTHALGSLLAKQEVGFHYYGEFFIFNAWNSQIGKINRYYPFFSLRFFINFRGQRRKWQYLRFEKTSLNAQKTLRAITKLPGVHVIKIFPQHFTDPLLQSLITEFKPHVIFLRRNHLDRFVSHKKANATGNWHTSSTSDVEIDLNPIEFERFITNYSKFYEDTLRCAKSSGCAILDLEFKDLHNPEKVRQMQQFAQFDGFSDWDKLVVAPTTRKQDSSNKVQEQFLAKTGKTYADYEFPRIAL